MADEADAAQIVEELQRNAALAGLRRALLPEEICGFDDCGDCERTIPKARRLILPHATRCTECQSIFEHKMGRGR